MADKTTPFVLRLDPTTRAQLTAAAEAEDRPAAYVAARAIRQWLEQREDAKAPPAPTIQTPYQLPPAPRVMGPDRGRDYLLRVIRATLMEAGTDVPDHRGRVVDVSKIRAAFWTSRADFTDNANKNAYIRGLNELLAGKAIGRDGNLVWLTP